MKGIVKNSLNPREIGIYSDRIYPIVKCGPFNVWVTTDTTDEDIRRAKKVGIARHLKVLKVVKICVPTFGYKGRFSVSPRVVLSQIDPSDLSMINGYSVKVKKPVNEFNRNLNRVDPTYYMADVKLYQAERRPIKLLLKKSEYLSSQESLQKN